MPEQLTYLAWLIPWAALVLALQWLAGAPELAARWRRSLAITAGVSVYLGIADRYALAQGIWRINPERSTGLEISGLPIEEALFFFLTTLMVVQSVILIMSPGLTPEVVLGRLRGYWRVVAGNGGSRKGGSH